VNDYIAPWLAAVLVVGSWLALAVVVTVGYVRINRRLNRHTSEHISSRYELRRFMHATTRTARRLAHRIGALEPEAVTITPAGTAVPAASPTWSARDDGVTVYAEQHLASFGVSLSIDGYSRYLEPVSAARIARDLQAAATNAMDADHQLRAAEEDARG
jgi:hypothetical protein